MKRYFSPLTKRYFFKPLIYVGLFCGLSCLPSPEQTSEQKDQKIIVFDIGDVLATYKKASMGFHAIGVRPTLKYVTSCLMRAENPFRPGRLTDMLEVVLGIFLKEHHNEIPNHVHDEAQVHACLSSPTKRVERINWHTVLYTTLCGLYTTEYVKYRLGEIIDNLQRNQTDIGKENFSVEKSTLKRFQRPTDCQMLKHVISCAFNGKQLAAYTAPIDGTCNLLTELANQENVSVCILSDYAQDSYQHLLNDTEVGSTIKKHTKEEHRIISHNVGARKPNYRMYEKIAEIAKEVGCKREDVIFIDDMSHNLIGVNDAQIDEEVKNEEIRKNLTGAQNFGFTTYHYAKAQASYKKLRKFLIEKGVLSQERATT